MGARTKILSVITVPTGGWVLPFQLSDVSQFDTSLNATIAAGDYFMAWDQQSDDFCKAVATAITVAVRAGPAAFATGVCTVDINPTTHKVNVGFEDGAGSVFQNSMRRRVKIRWTTTDGPSVAAVLGFDSSTDSSSTGQNDPIYTGGYHHAYGWYADDDGLLQRDLAENSQDVLAEQSKHPSGYIKTQYLGTRFENILSLAFLPRAKTLSANRGYTESPVWPRNGGETYLRNAALECWFMRAVQGKRFRVYRDSEINTAKAADSSSSNTSASLTTLTDAGKAWSVEPFRWTGRILYLPNWSANSQGARPLCTYISSHTTTALTVSSNGYINLTDSDPYYILDHPFDTFVLDVGKMSRFAPVEMDAIDLFNVEIPLLKYVAA